VEAAALGGEVDLYRLHPALLDACLHPLLAAWADRVEGTYLPVRIESISLSERSRDVVWSHATLRSAGDAATDLQVGDILLLDAAEQVVGQIRGLIAKRIDPNALLRASGIGRDWLYELQWRIQVLPEAGAPAGETRGPGSWLVLADSGGVGADLMALLVRAGGSCLCVRPGDAFAMDHQGAVQVRTDRPDDLRRALAKLEEDGNAACRGVVDLWGLDAEMREEIGEEQLEQAQLLACGGLISALQATAGQERPPRLWVVTRGAQAVGTGRPSVAQSPVWGLCRTLALEHPELSPVCVDLDPAGQIGDAEILWREMRSGTDEDQVAFRQGTRYVARLARVKPETGRAPVAGGREEQPLRLDVVARGTLDQLHLQAVSRHPPGPGEIEVRVRATGLNFRDVLNVLGLYPGEAGPPGNECAGTVVAVGEGVHIPRVGDAVVALAPASFATYVTTRADLVVPKPAALSFEEAAAVPIAYLTADYALNHLARMGAGDRVLIHAAAGGVGLAAVALAHRAGAEVFATAGSEEKHAFLRGLGVSHVMDSRSVEFAAELMERTGGRGVTVVLNSLSGDFIPRSLSTLAPQGRFVEIGRRGIWDAAQVAVARPDVSYWVLFMGEVFDTKPELTRAMLTSLLQGCAEGSIGRLPQRVFPLTQAVDAFRTMAQARHIGKIVLTQTEAPPAATPMDRPIRAGASYLITGGLGGLGLRVAEWMAASGARHLVLLGRRSPMQPAIDTIRRLVEQGVEVRVVQADVSRSVAMEPVLADVARTMPPLRGVVHAAGVLEDGVLLRQDWERFRAALAPKAIGAWVLHRLTRGLPLDFFVLFSSAASLIGSRGQGSYAAANAFLDSLAHARRADGLPATSIDWGAWAEIGMAARLEARRPSGSAQRGLGAIPPSRGVEILERILREGFVRVGVLPIDWPTFRRQWEAGTVPPLWRDIVGDVTTSVGRQHGVAATAGLAERLAQAPVERQRSVVLNHVSDQVKKVLGLGASHIIDSEQGLRDLGMDSLMSVELRNTLQASLGRPLPSTLAFDHPTIASLTDYLAEKVLGLATPQPGVESEDQARAIAEVASLSDTEAESLLVQELARQHMRQP
jgi:NADPH:quinone reductase-like Zn-dependent oxidoreductase/NADP-dependent 3-hydroxy acid dehydrogenase YdfG/acyl carrier protein